MISAFAKGAQVLEDSRYRDAARATAEFLLSRLYDGANATLLRRYRDGEAAIPGFLDDYAFFVQGLLDLYETVFDTRYLDLAGKLTDTQLARFEDSGRGGFYTTPAGASGPAPRMKNDYDGAEPSGNSIAILNLLRLSALLGRPSYREAAKRALRWFAPFLASAPEAAPQMLAALSSSSTPPRQIVLLGDQDAEDTRALLRAIHGRFLPHQALLVVDGDEARRFLSAGWPAIAAMQRVNGAATAYLCENHICRLPVTDPREIAR
jgi:uncharacterized protein YyaL (SSP411 family)